jgi:hypothetical protein
MRQDQLVLIAKVFQRLGNPGVRVWDVADYLAHHDPEARYSGPLKFWWHRQIMAALKERGDFWFVHRGTGVYEVEGTIPELVPEEPPLLDQPRLLDADVPTRH